MHNYASCNLQGLIGVIICGTLATFISISIYTNLTKATVPVIDQTVISHVHEYVFYRPSATIDYRNYYNYIPNNRPVLARQRHEGPIDYDFFINKILNHSFDVDSICEELVTKAVALSRIISHQFHLDFHKFKWFGIYHYYDVTKHLSHNALVEITESGSLNYLSYLYILKLYPSICDYTNVITSNTLKFQEYKELNLIIKYFNQELIEQAVHYRLNAIRSGYIPSSIGHVALFQNRINFDYNNVYDLDRLKILYEFLCFSKQKTILLYYII
jgi:hypothetical protein